MKKYWQLLLIAVLIFAVISVHYIQVANASNNYNFTFEKISGDDKYLDSVLIEGYIEGGRMFSKPIEITKDETTLIDTSYPFRKLIDKHKSFMRGKVHYAYNYYEDEARLIYVEEPEEVWKLNSGDPMTYNIDVLNKDDNTTASFSVTSKLINPGNWVSIAKITLINNELKLITRQTSENDNNEIHLVIIDMNKQQLLSDTILDKPTNTKTMATHINFYNDYLNFQQEKYVVYAINNYDTMSEDYKIVSQQFKVINTETNEINDIDLPEGSRFEAFNGVVDNDYLVISTSTNTGMELYRYYIPHQQWLEPITVTHPFKVLNKDTYIIQAMDGNIYIMNQAEKGYLLQIYSIEENKSLYEGVLTKKDTKYKYELWITDISKLKE